MKRIALIALLTASAQGAFAQKFITRTGKVSFFSSTAVENIEAINNESQAAIDAATGNVAFQIPVKSFHFENALMQEHFNENYMESDKFPTATFKGKITNPGSVSFGKDGTYNVTAAGQLTIHGVTHDVSSPGIITIKAGQVTAYSKFKVKTADYGIKIPGIAAGKVAESIEITVNSILAAK